jgi:hypothetical protein
MPHDAHDGLARHQPAAGRGFDNGSERLMSQDQPVASRRRSTELATHQLEIRAADAHGRRADEHRSFRGRRLGHVVEAR